MFCILCLVTLLWLILNTQKTIMNKSYIMIAVLLMFQIFVCLSVTETDSTTSQMGNNDYIATESDLNWPFRTLNDPGNDYPFSSTYGPRLQASNSYAFDYHRGIDIPRTNGTNLYAVQDALVFRNRVSSSGDKYITLKIQHSQGARAVQGYKYFYPTYRHLQSTNVIEGSTVQKGDLLALSGASASGFNHLHFDIAVGASYEYRNTHPLYYLDYPNTDVPHIAKINQNYVHTPHKKVSFEVTVSSTELDLIEVSVKGTFKNQYHEAIYNLYEENRSHPNKVQLDNATQTLANGVVVEIGLIHHNAQNTIKTYYFTFDFSQHVNGNLNSYDLQIEARDVRDGYERVHVIGS